MWAVGNVSKSTSTGHELTVVVPRMSASREPRGTVSTTSLPAPKSSGSAVAILTVPWSVLNHQLAVKGIGEVEGAPTGPANVSCGSNGAGTSKWYSPVPSGFTVTPVRSVGTKLAGTPCDSRPSVSATLLVS